MSEKIKYIKTDQFEELVLKKDKVVLDFYSTECPPCEALASKYDDLSEVYGDDIHFYKIFRQENRELAESLGVKSSPTVLFYKDGNEVGERLSGGIKRTDLIENLDMLIEPSRAEEIKNGFKSSETSCDVLIIGGGPAGLTAGIYTAQAKLNTIIVDQALPGGQVTTTHLVSNYPGFDKPIEGFMLMHYMSEQAKNAGVHFRSAVDITDIDLTKKSITIDGLEKIHTKKIIIATGASYRELGLKGEKEYKGKGISYCATCDAKYYDEKDVIVIGGGNSAIEESIFITKFAKKVTIVHQFDKLQANKLAQEKAFANEKIDFIFEHEPREFSLREDGSMEVTVEDLKQGTHKTLSCAGVFIFAGMVPNIDLFDNKLELDKWGSIQTDEDMKTSIPDVYAVGDVKGKRFRQITTAVSDGTIAAINISQELEE